MTAITYKAVTEAAKQVAAFLNCTSKNPILCAVCQDRPEREKHHVFPTHLGGKKDGPLVALCGDDHDLIHRAASAIIKNTRYEHPVDIDKQRLFRAQKLIDVIVAAKLLDNTNNTEQMRKTSLEIPVLLLKDLHKRKLDQGFTNLQSYILHLLKKDVSNI